MFARLHVNINLRQTMHECVGIDATFLHLATQFIGEVRELVEQTVITCASVGGQHEIATGKEHMGGVLGNNGLDLHVLWTEERIAGH